ncbi:hypothetical protein DUI87_26364 [Hirundo rustica rustica]|uniref:AP complex mu/sigma subunit domain-containing protein n=1 Tax=Hirundo rustica rustica TaxID=333673 RepID=A0A3M0J6W8_HIRRU|nr:hypothetical protein DUI87_26364 [Hirundo rustica rustica]
MIKAILIFNNHGKPRLSKFYQRYSEDTQQQIIRETFHLVSKRDENVCNFLEGGLLIGGSDNKLIYRHYATLYFVFCVDSSESELGILDLIQVSSFVAFLIYLLVVLMLLISPTLGDMGNYMTDFHSLSCGAPYSCYFRFIPMMRQELSVKRA